MLKPPLNDVTSKVEYNRMNQIKIEKLNNFNNLCKEMKYFYEFLKCKHEIFPLFRSIFQESGEKSVFHLDNAKPLKKKHA